MYFQIVKEVVLRFFKKFDVDYEVWLQVICIILQLDCLMSLVKLFFVFGFFSCCLEFVDDEWSVLYFEEFCYLCMINRVDDFIFNDIYFGGEQVKINFFIGVNVVGKLIVF